MAEICKFTREFDGTFMSADEIRNKARALGWNGLRVDVQLYMDTGKLTVTRLPRDKDIQMTTTNKMPCHISDGPRDPDDLPVEQIEIDPDDAYDIEQADAVVFGESEDES